MIIQVLIALFLVVPAYADLSDSGNLTIGGQGIIQGTMTVQGAGFSVGAATFSVAGGSVTLGGRLNAAAAGIKWADGTTSTTASSGGTSGDASEEWLASKDASSVSSMTFYSTDFLGGFLSSTTYRLKCAFRKDSTGAIVYHTFNGVDSASYGSNGLGYRGCSGVDNLGTDSGSGCRMNPGSNNISNTAYTTEIEFGTGFGNTDIQAFMQSAGDNAGCWGLMYGTCRLGSSGIPLTKVAIRSSSGNFAGVHCDLYRSGRQHL